MHVKTAFEAAKAIKSSENGAEATELELTSLDDVLMFYLDRTHGPSVNEHSVWTKLTSRFEQRFTEDMRALDCLDADEVTRVTEYGPQIVKFVERIEKNKFAYETEGNVYFDITAFEAANNKYARLEPWNRNDTNLQADGEGALSQKESGKRSPADFALWKASKPGEPSWPSPWGPGRPGWHIECSTMAFDKLGSQIDIHSGGIDLAFPHHDNELAQSEAYWADQCQGHQHQWINYFLHMGHLSIAGAKMSKSLKNFTTIRTALSRGDFTSRSLRIVFLLGVWKDGIEITDALIKEGSAWEDKLNNFFIKVREIQETAPRNGVVEHKHLDEALERAKEETFQALCDNFHTPSGKSIVKPNLELVAIQIEADKRIIRLPGDVMASSMNSFMEITNIVRRIVMSIISNLITIYHTNSMPAPSAILRIAEWVTSMVNMFGLNGTGSPEGKNIGWSGIDISEGSKPVLTVLSQKRDTLRQKVCVPGKATFIKEKSISNIDWVYLLALETILEFVLTSIHVEGQFGRTLHGRP